MRFMMLSLATALITIAVKVAAAVITGSVGLLSDALESGVNLVAAVVALFALRTAARPPDENHHFGHGKAEYLSAAVEGGMILVAATAIVWTSVERIVHPLPVERIGIGMVLSALASVLNLVVGMVLIRAGRRHRSITLVADGKHLLTDVWTTVGVLVGVGLVAVFDWVILDPIVALLVGLNILWTGYQLIHRSVVGLLDATLPPEDVAQVHAVIESFRAAYPVDFHALQTRESGRQRFVYLHLLVPDGWTVKQAHDLSMTIEAELAQRLPGSVTFTHIEPRDDPASYGHGLADAEHVTAPRRTDE